MDTLVSMKVFRHVVEVGSFVGAAERMEMSAAMASKHAIARTQASRQKAGGKSHNQAGNIGGGMCLCSCRINQVRFRA